MRFSLLLKTKPSKEGYIYINEIKMINNGKKTIGYKPGYCIDMKKRKFIYKLGNFFYKLLSYSHKILFCNAK
jgi:hypothetical protein